MSRDPDAVRVTKVRDGLAVTVYGDDFERTLQKFRQQVTRAGLLRELRQRAVFIPRSERRRVKFHQNQMRLRRKATAEAKAAARERPRIGAVGAAMLAAVRRQRGAMSG